jgi:hypothetical protein
VKWCFVSGFAKFSSDAQVIKQPLKAESNDSPLWTTKFLKQQSLKSLTCLTKLNAN